MTLKPSTFPLFSSSNPQAFDLRPSQRGWDRLWHLFLNFFSNYFMFSLLMFIGMRVMRPSRKEISSMLFIFTPKEFTSYLGLSKYKEVTSYPRFQWASQVFPKIIVMVVGLQHVWLIRDIYFNNRKSPGFTKGCRSSHWVKSNFP